MPNFSVAYQPFGKFLINDGGGMCEWRCKSFLTKEPTTLDWMQSFDSKGTLLDVGANIGIYTVPSALFHVTHVVAIEPEPSNYNQLVTNCRLNNLFESGSVTTIPLAVTSEGPDLVKLFLSKENVGGSCHQAGSSTDFLLREIPEANRPFRTVPTDSLEHIIYLSLLDKPKPYYLKVDVDGIEYDVLSSLFRSSLVGMFDSIQVELNPKLPPHHVLISNLIHSGFIFDSKQVQRARRSTGAFAGYAEYVFNQLYNYENYTSVLKKVSIQDTYPDQYLFSKLSESPLAGTIKLPITSSQALQAYTRILDSLEHIKDHSFKNARGVQVGANPTSDLTSSLRKKLKWNTFISIIDSQFCSILENFIEPEYLSALLSKLYSSKLGENVYKDSKFLSGFSLISRMRLFVDHAGYSLSRHNDSPDTLLAFVFPLLPYSRSTALLSQTVSPRTMKLDQLPTHVVHIPDSFGNKLIRYNPYTCDYYEFDTADKSCALFKSTNISLSYGETCEAIILGNSNSDILSSKSSKPSSPRFGHWVPPVFNQFRPVLLIDILTIHNSALPNVMAKIDSDIEKISVIGNLGDVLHS